MEKTEEELVEEVRKNLKSGYQVIYFNDCLCLWTDIMKQQCERQASVVTAAVHLYDFYAR